MWSSYISHVFEVYIENLAIFRTNLITYTDYKGMQYVTLDKYANI